MNKTKIVFFSCVLVLTLNLNNIVAQNNDIGSWNIFYVKLTLNDKWNLFAESQLRSLKFYDQFHYYEYKGGYNYSIEKNIKHTLGIGSYQTYKEGGNFIKPKNNDEIRIWPQIILLQTSGKLKIEHRYRAEFRFTSNGYRNRLRYRFGLFYQFGKESQDNKFKPFQISLSNEIFFSNIEPYFERNRILLALNYKINSLSSVQVGYLHQFDYKIFDEIGRDFIQIGYFIDIKKKDLETFIDLDIKDH